MSTDPTLQAPPDETTVTSAGARAATAIDVGFADIDSRVMSRRPNAWMLVCITLLLWSVGSASAAEPAPQDAPIVAPSLNRFVSAELPEGTAFRDVDVIVTITIAVDGSVSKVTLTKGGGEPYDGAAIAAIQKMTFRPATRGGVAIAVNVPFTYEYRIPRRRGSMLPSRRGRTIKEVAPGRIYVGTVVEMGTRTPLAGVPVLVTDPRTQRSYQTITDVTGKFILEGLPPGKLQLTVVAPDHQGKRGKPVTIEGVTIAKGAAPPESAKTVYLNPKAYSKFRTVVKENRRKEAAAEITLTRDELTKVPGTFGDPTRVIATLPGVARSSFGLGYYVVRGASTENTGFLIDGHPAGYLYHLGGGPSVLHPALVDKIRFYPAGYPAKYGRFAGGLIAIEQRENPDDRWHLDLEVDLTKATVLFSIPFDDKKGMVTLSFRRSYFELLLAAAAAVDDSLSGITFAYTDYQARIRYDITPELRWSFYVFGAEDELGQADAGALGIGFHRVRTAFEYTPSKELSWKTSANFAWFHTNAAEVAEDTEALSIGLESWYFQVRSVVELKPTKFLRLDVGIDALYTDLSADLRINIPNILGQVPGAQADIPFDSFQLGDQLTSIAPFLYMDWEPVKGFRLIPSVRLNIEHWGGDLEITADPKLATRIAVHDAVTVKAMAAIAHQAPNPVVTAAPFGDPSLPPVTAYQASVGVEIVPADGWEISVEGFYNHFQDLLQGNQGDNALDETLFQSDLSGRSYGLEVLIRKNFGGWAYGWLSYTLSRAERKSGPNEPWVLFGQDQTHILNLAWTFVLPDEWSIGARFQLTSGNPYNPVIGSKYDADAGRYRPRTALREGRLPIFHRLDLRIDKRIRYDTYFIEIFLDIQNVYNSQNPETLQYSFDYKITREGQGLPIIPTLGVRIAF